MLEDMNRLQSNMTHFIEGIWACAILIFEYGVILPQQRDNFLSLHSKDPRLCFYKADSAISFSYEVSCPFFFPSACSTVFVSRVFRVKNSGSGDLNKLGSATHLNIPITEMYNGKNRKIYSVWVCWNKWRGRPVTSSQVTLRLLIWDLGLKKGQEVCIIKQHQ